MLGSNWKGRVGGVGGMLSGLAAMIHGLSCVAVSLSTGDPMTNCFNEIMTGASAFSLGLAAFGIRQAVGSVAVAVNVPGATAAEGKPPVGG